MKIHIIGAGIGGLTTAIALQRKGFEVEIFDQAREIKPVGAGIILANNAMQVYDKLGMRSEIEAGGNYISAMNLTTPDLKPISRMDLKYFEAKHNVKNVAIHRGGLQKILVDKLKPESLHLGFELTNIENSGNKYFLNFNEKQSVTSTVLIGADGLNSTIRNCLFSENEIRHANQICWRGVTEFQLPEKYRHELNEAWGKGERFGFVQIEPEKVYWYALKSAERRDSMLPLAEIEDFFKNYHSMVCEIIRATPKVSIHTAEISDLQPIHEWHKGKVCLLGDAAHATTPNMGQGACQAIEDAYVLSECLNKYEPEEAFSTYQKLRMPKAHQVVNTSWTLGKIAHLSNPLAVAVRNQVMRMTPPWMNRKQSEKIFRLSEV